MGLVVGLEVSLPHGFTKRSLVLLPAAALAPSPGNLSLFTRAQSLCLVNRLRFLGEGARAAAGRRTRDQLGEAMRQRELQAHYQAHVRGRGLSRVGQVFVP